GGPGGGALAGVASSRPSVAMEVADRNAERLLAASEHRAPDESAVPNPEEYAHAVVRELVVGRDQVLEAVAIEVGNRNVRGRLLPGAIARERLERSVRVAQKHAHAVVRREVARDGEVGLLVGVEVADDDRVRDEAGFVVDLRREGAVAVVQVDVQVAEAAADRRD